MSKYIVPPEFDGSRIDSFIASFCRREQPDDTDGAEIDGESISRSAAAKLAEGGDVAVNGKAVGKKFKVKAGDSVDIDFPPLVPDVVCPEDIPLDVVFEDDDVIVVNKPAGMVVHPAAGNREGTLVAALLAHCGGSLSGIGGVMRPGIVHRIDKDTTGLIVAAKNDTAHRSLALQIKEHSAYRTYLALVIGVPRGGEGTVDAPIGRHVRDRKKMAVLPSGSGAREAVTHWRVIEEFAGLSLVECRLETGRTHQIRVHMAYIGHPVLGDAVYGGANHPFAQRHTDLIKGQCLHACSLELDHPRTGERMHFVAPLPPETEKLLAILRRES